MSRRWLWVVGLAFVYLICFAWGSQYAAAQDPKPPAEEQAEAPAEGEGDAKEGDAKEGDAKEGDAKEGDAKKPASANGTTTTEDGRFDLSALKDPNRGSGTTVPQRFQSLLGMAFLIGLCVVMSNNRSKISWKLVAWGLGLQLILGIFVMHFPLGQWIFGKFNIAFDVILEAVKEGSSFLFGKLAEQNNLPVADANPGAYGPFALEREMTTTGQYTQVGAYFAFFVLPTIIVFSSLMAILYHIGLMQGVVKVVAVVMQKTMGTSGAETLSASGNIFVGQTEAPLLVKPFVKGMSQSELMAVMTGGFATVAGGVMAAYVGMLQSQFAGIAGHLLSASVMSAPAALVCAKIIVPEPDPTKCETYGELKVNLKKVDVNAIDAAARGAGEGLTLAFNVGAMLLAFLALVHLANMGIGFVGNGTANLVYGTPWSERLSAAQGAFGGLDPEDKAKIEQQRALLDLAQEAAAASGIKTALTAEAPKDDEKGEQVIMLAFSLEHSGPASLEGSRIVFGADSFLAGQPGFQGVALPKPKPYEEMSEAEQDAADSAWWESGWRTLSLQKILGFLLAPLAWLMGVPKEDMFQVGQLIGIKSVVNEFVAYLQLADMCKPGAANALSHPRSVVIATYALCGFANLGSIGIQLGGIGGIAPERRGDLAKIGFRAMIAGTIAALLTATVAGMLIP